MVLLLLMVVVVVVVVVVMVLLLLLLLLVVVVVVVVVCGGVVVFLFYFYFFFFCFVCLFVCFVCFVCFVLFVCCFLLLLLIFWFCFFCCCFFFGGGGRGPGVVFAFPSENISFDLARNDPGTTIVLLLDECMVDASVSPIHRSTPPSCFLRKSPIQFRRDKERMEKHRNLAAEKIRQENNSIIIKPKQ